MGLFFTRNLRRRLFPGRAERLDLCAESHVKGSVLATERQWKHANDRQWKAVEGQGKKAGSHQLVQLDRIQEAWPATVTVSKQ